MIREQLEDLFQKSLPVGSPGELADRLVPRYMKQTFESMGLNKENPAMYAMVCWMDEEHEREGLNGITFHEFMEQAIYYFN